MKTSELFDDGTRKLFLSVIGIAILIIFFFPMASGATLLNVNFVPFINELRNERESSFKKESSLEENVDYRVIFYTADSSFTIDLYENSAPINVSGVVDHNIEYLTSEINFLETVGLEIGTKNQIRLPQEINANFLNLDQRKVKNSPFLDTVYNSAHPIFQHFSETNLLKYEEFSLKDFYKEVLKYEYNEELSTPSNKEFQVYTKTTGKNRNTLSLIVQLNNDMPIYDGIYTPIGILTDGEKVLQNLDENTSFNRIEVQKT